LDLLDAALERVERLVAMALDGVEEALEPLLDLLHRAARDGVHTLGEDAVGLSREAFDGKVELAAEAPRGLLARRADSRVELLRRGLGVARRLLRDRAPQLLELPRLDLAEGERHALHRLGLLRVDLLLQLALAPAEAVGQLLERPPPLGALQ